MSVQDIEQAVADLDPASLRRIRSAIDARLREGEELAYDQIEDLAGVLDGGPTDLSTNKRYLEGMGESSLR